MIQVVNTTSTSLTAGATIPTGSVRVRTNSRVNYNNGNLEIVRPGTYKVEGNFVVTATAAGAIQAQMNVNGTAVPGAIAAGTAAAAGDEITLPVSFVVQAAPAAPGNSVAINWTVSAACTLTNAEATITRVV